MTHYRRLLLLALGLPLLALAAGWLWALSPNPWLLGLSRFLVRPALFLVLVFAGLTGLLFVSHHPGRMMGEPDRGELSRGARRAVGAFHLLALGLFLGGILDVLPPWSAALAILLVSPFGALPTTLATSLGLAQGLIAWLYALLGAALLTPFAARFVPVAYPEALILLVMFVGAVLPAPVGHPLGGRRAHGWCLALTAGFLLFCSSTILHILTQVQCENDRVAVLVKLPRAPRAAPEGFVLESKPAATGYRQYKLHCALHPEAGESTFLERER